MSNEQAARPSVPEQGQGDLQSALWSLEQAIRLTKKEKWSGRAQWKENAKALTAALAASRSEAQPPQGWNLTSEKTPTLGEECIVMSEYKIVQHSLAIFSGKEWIWLAFRDADNAPKEKMPYWMPINRPGAPAAGSAERWIPVSEKLPEKVGESYLVLIAANGTEYQDVWRFHPKGWLEPKTVTHWRPLPSPPALAGTHTDVAKEEK